VLLLHPSSVANASRTRAPTLHSKAASVQKAIEQREAAFLRAFEAKDADALADLYDENAILIPPDRDPIRGKVAIRRFYREFTAKPERLEDEEFTPLALDLCGDFAIDVSAFTGHMQAADKPREEFHGKNLVVWRRQPDGSWKYYRDMWDVTFQ